jgi:PhzF family phenazine biosynthesis protein
MAQLTPTRNTDTAARDRQRRVRKEDRPSEAAVMFDASEVLRYAAFTEQGAGGNPAGIVLDASGMDDAERLEVAAKVGYSETAFVEPGDREGQYRLRFFSPLAEVAFCGHATIATAVVLAEKQGAGERHFETLAGPVPVETSAIEGGYMATMVSVPTRTRPATDQELDETLQGLRWHRADLDRRYPPHVAYAGNEHLILAVRSREQLASLQYDYALVAAVMAARAWTTLHLVYAHSPTLFSARNPFPPGGVVEDPATGAAAAAFGGYLRDLRLVDLPATITLLQGEDMGRPSRLIVDVSAQDAQVRLTGTASPIR